MYILFNTSELLNCNNPVLASVLIFIKRALSIIQIIVPILLIIGLSLVFFNMMISAKDEKEKAKYRKRLTNSIISAVIIFLVPVILNTLMSAVSSYADITTYNISYCWTQIDNAYKELGSKSAKSALDGSNIIRIRDNEVYESSSEPAFTESNRKYATLGTENNTNTNSENSSTTSTTTDASNLSNSGTGILIIAGHSYSPYCSSFPGKGDCREENSSSCGSWCTGYYEPTLTREIAVLLKQELDKKNIPSAIANQLLGGTDAKMNKSLFLERSNNTQNWKNLEPKVKNYKYAIEFHFNATSNHSAKHTVVLYNEGQRGVSALDNEICQATASAIGVKCSQGTAGFTVGNITYFNSINKNLTYLETAFYDNKESMRLYNANKNKVASAIADVYQKYYNN